MKAGLFAKSLEDFVSASCPAADGSTPNLSPLLHMKDPTTTMLGRSWSGAWGVGEHLLFFWLKLFHCTEKPWKFNRSKRVQEEIWLYHLVWTVSWNKESCIPTPLQRVSACFYMEKPLDNIKKKNLTLFSSLCLLGLCISALCRRNPYAKYEASLAEWKDKNMLSKLLYLSYQRETILS